MNRTIDKIESGTLKLDEFSESQQRYIKALVKLSYNEGLEQGETYPLGAVSLDEQSEATVCDHPDNECMEDRDGYTYCKKCNTYPE